MADIIKLIGEPFSRGALFQFRQPGGTGNIRSTEGTFRRFAIEQRRGYGFRQIGWRVQPAGRCGENKAAVLV